MRANKLSVLLAGILCWGLGVNTANADDGWRETVGTAYSDADVVIRATVEAVDNQTAVDGGHVYTLRVAATQKGSIDNLVSVRAGGWLYTLPLKKGESFTFFLKDKGREHYALVDASQFRPMVFNSAGTPVDARLSTDFAGLSDSDLNDLLEDLGAQQ